MPALFVPEETSVPQQLALNHPLTVAAQIHHGLDRPNTATGASHRPTSPRAGRDYGVEALGLNPDGYVSDEDNTHVDRGFGTCPGREAKPVPPPAAYTNGVVTPHAAFLALRWAPGRCLTISAASSGTSRRLYGQWGFRDSVNVGSGTVSDTYLSLDQGIIMAAIGDALGDDMLRHAFATKEVEAALQPLLSLERFGAGPRSRAVRVDTESPCG